MRSRRSRVDGGSELVLSCLEQIETRGIGVLDEFCERFPEHAETLRQRIEPLHAAGLLESAEPKMPERLGDFELLSRLGGGGMGVVYRARQVSLGREVALKLIRPDQLAFPETRARFRREVEVVARLEHAGIVPVYAFGEESGTPFFAMQRIHGATLHELLEALRGRDPATLHGSDLSEAWRAVMAERGESEVECKHGNLSAMSWSEACVTLVLQVARALTYAHGQGVLHRDVKPSNVLLGQDGRALLFDFGLSSSDWVDRLTQSGSVFGSLSFMSAEQVTGRDVDERTDLYALGVSLYELLCLRLPYGDLGAIELREAIIQGNPASIRARNPGVPVDLETVTLKAMDCDPEQRYAHAALFAEDLENVLALRSIQARPAGMLRRTQRWIQRNRARALALALAFCLMVVGPALFAVQRQAANRKLSVALSDTTAQRVLATKERERAEANLDEAFDMVLILMDRLGRNTWDDLPGIDELRAESLADARQQLEGLMRQRESYPWAERLHARISRRLADAYYRTGKLDQARLANESALRGFRGLLGGEFETRTQRGLVAALGQRALLLEQDGLKEEAQSARREALDLLEGLWAQGLRDPSLRTDLATMNQQVGGTLTDAGEIDEGRPLLERSLLLLEDLVNEEGAERILVGAYLSALTSLALGERVYGDAEAGALYASEARERLGELLAKNPSDRAGRESLMVLNSTEAGMWKYGLSLAECEERAFEGLALLEGLERDYPGFVMYTNRRSQLRYLLLAIMTLDGRASEADPLFVEWIALERELVRKAPSYGAQRGLALLLSLHSRTLRSLGEHDRALQASAEALQLFEALVAKHPGQPDLMQRLGSEGLVHARLVLKTGGRIDLASELRLLDSRLARASAISQVIASFAAEAHLALLSRGEYDQADEALERGLDYLEAGARDAVLTHKALLQDPDLNPYHGNERWDLLLDGLKAKD